MAKLAEIVRTAKRTRVKNRSKVYFLAFFFFTHLMHSTFRKMPPLGRSLKWISTFLPHPVFIIENQAGLFSVTPFNDTVTTSADYYDQRLRPWLERPTDRGIFLDLGANIGRYTLLAAKHFAYKKVLAVEGSPVTYQLLQDTISLNGIEKTVISHQAAISNYEGVVQFQIDPYHLGGGLVVDEKTGYLPFYRRDEVSITTVDILLKKYNLDPGEVDFVKIDVEGLECEVLEGMKDLIREMPLGSYIMIEVADHNLNKVTGMLSEYGFKAAAKDGNDNLFGKMEITGSSPKAY